MIDLSATCAAKIDPEEFGIHYYNSDEPADDREGFAAYAARYFAIVLFSLNYYYRNISLAGLLSYNPTRIISKTPQINLLN